MSVIDDLQESLGETKRGVEKVLDDLRSYSDVRESLQSANKSIKASSDGLNSLASNLSNSVESLDQLTRSLGQVTDLIQRTDPGLMLEAQRKAESKVDSLGDSIAEVSHLTDSIREQFVKLAVAQRFDAVDQKLLELANQSNSVDQKLSALVQQSDTVDQKISDLKADQVETKKNIERIAGKMPLILGGLVIVVLILGYGYFWAGGL
jgi:uncharacterized phage infection (PIP) family protein YhgE